VPEEGFATTTRALGGSSVALGAPTLADAPAVCELVANSQVLDANSLYCYLLLCRDFSDTCVVARVGSALAGFVTSYRPPARADTVFIWQIGVAEGFRRQGIAKRLLRALLSRPSCRSVRYLEATVTPSNAASQRLFQKLADDLEVPIRVEREFTAEMFGGGNHEEELRIRIGPLADKGKESLPK
jgi:L-2,4-diaminobutyric acid acetyltransferase